MKKRIYIIALTAGTILLASCGTSKKLETANTENTRLQKMVAEQSQTIASNEKLIGQLKTENAVYGKEAADCRQIKDAVAQKFETLNKNLAAQGTSLEEIRSHVAESITNFQDAGATVDYKNGMIHITLDDKFFFKAGSATIGVKGREALNIVADVMRKYPGVQTIIVGNTDNTEMKGNIDNWTLSTERANAVVRVLELSYYVDPKRLTAAGRSMYNPVGDNSTADGKARNRRIEIIFNPDLSRIWNLLEK
ncbi:MAG: OmpA family protein [Bacteroidota bacterium]